MTSHQHDMVPGTLFIVRKPVMWYMIKDKRIVGLRTPAVGATLMYIDDNTIYLRRRNEALRMSCFLTSTNEFVYDHPEVARNRFVYGYIEIVDI